MTDDLLTMIYPLPVYNHNFVLAQKENFGYVEGVLFKDIPFVAEKWSDVKTDEISVSFLLPYIKELWDDSVSNICENNGNILPEQLKCRYNGILTEGMLVLSESIIFTVLEQHVAFLEAAGAIKFEKCYNGAIKLLKDYADNLVVEVIISLQIGAKKYAATDIKFIEFLNKQILL
ncbi:hypothetical protein [Phascolarctobacterium sp.]